MFDAWLLCRSFSTIFVGFDGVHGSLRCIRRKAIGKEREGEERRGHREELCRKHRVTKRARAWEGKI